MDKEYQQEIANTIIQQMGGRKLCAMVGAKNFTYGTIDYNGFEQPYMLFQFCRIIYNQGSDTYIFQLLNNKAVVKFDLADVYAEDLIPLFEEKTGLYLSL